MKKLERKDFTSLNFMLTCLGIERGYNFYLDDTPDEAWTEEEHLGILIEYISRVVGDSINAIWEQGMVLYYICLDGSKPIICADSTKCSKFRLYFQTPYLAEKVIKEFECIFRMFWKMDIDFQNGIFENKFTYPLKVKGLP